MRHTRTDLYPAAIFALLASIAMLFVFGTARAGDLECEGATHCVLMQMTPWHEDRDEPDVERWDRMKTIAEGVNAATDKRVGRSFLLMTGWYESRYARFVHHDEKRCREGIGGWCDNGRSFSPWQLKKMTREETIAESAKIALERFESRMNYCAARGFDPVEGGVSLYATGNTCEWPEAKERARALWRIHWMLGRGE